MLLYPFENKTFIVGIGIYYIFEIKIFVEYPAYEKLLCFFEAFVKKDCTDQCLECIPVKISCRVCRADSYLPGSYLYPSKSPAD
jgi:hypothetical protein